MRYRGLAFGIAAALGISVAGAQQVSMPPPAGTIGNLCAYNASPGTIATGNAGWVQCDANGRILTSIAASSYFTNVAGSTLTRPADTTTYTANTTVCLAKSVTACAPGTISIASSNAGKGIINRVSLLKSGTSVTAANFTIWFFSAAPRLTTPTQYDNVAYSGPRAADMPNYIGNAVCSSPVATSDTTPGVWYDCLLSNPNTGGALDFQALAGSTNINYLISATAAYAPAANSETFIPYVSGIY